MFSEKKVLWLIYTVLFGMVPIFMRLLASGLVNGGKIPWITASDVISLGIVLHISLLAEIRYNDTEEAVWKKQVVGLSVLAVVFYAVMYVFSLLAEVYKDIDSLFVLLTSIGMVVGSFAMCWAVYDRLTYAPGQKDEVAA
ncbi:hypothetical protein EON09_23595 [Pseudomonas soli]|uniref:hypothetical protein n=1 Tax=Pseudomonas soli TaxID=1306993 RepID=UPI001160DC5A|nr:hypothetical protein [Pseudomonas soli]NBK41510.1 hypothetical protein [Pseudomonas soli]WJO23424.1 hypothetical protein LU688_07560 [Pseudomonas soli]